MVGNDIAVIDGPARCALNLNPWGRDVPWRTTGCHEPRGNGLHIGWPSRWSLTPKQGIGMPMNRRAWKRLQRAAEAVLASFFVIFATGASAHVKWFCTFDVAGQPRGLENILCSDFEELVGLAMLILTTACLMDRTWIGDALLRAHNRITSALQSDGEVLIRAICGFFFIALWATEGTLLTPELKTASAAVPWLQLAVASGLIWRRTMPLSAVGIAVLFALAVHDYGLFHLADYPIFLGIAAYFTLVGLQRDLFGIRPLDVVRYSAAVTLMWASIEKWAYPEWTFPLFIEHPRLTLGFDQEFFMRAAGVIEFTLAFSLLWTPLFRRASALILATMFISATFEFGKIDVIGHAPIIAVMLAVTGDSVAAARLPHRLTFAAPIAYCVALAGFVGAYYVAHAMLFGTQIL